MDLGQAIKTLRQKQGMTQQQLADMCGFSDAAISNLETGKAYPPKSTVERLCAAFGVSPACLLMASIEEGDFPEGKRALYGMFFDPLRTMLLDNKNP